MFVISQTFKREFGYEFNMGGFNMKKRIFTLLILLVSLTLVFAGCGNKQSGKESNKKEKVSATSGASKASYTSIKKLKEKYDIIIVGAGGAGMSAALEAKEKGMNPVIFEKMPIAGGNTTKSSSGMNASETKFQKQQGIKDSNDAFYKETLEGGHGTNDKALLRYFVDHSASAINWLDSMGIKLNNITITGGMKEKRTHRPKDGSAVGKYLVNGLLKNVQEKNIPVFVNANVKEIEQKDGKVTGVKVLFNGKKEKVISSKAVVVTTGGFGANKKLIAKEKPELKGYVSTNQKGSTGDGIKMIQKLGGQTVDMDQIQVHPTVQQKKAYLIGEAVRGEGAILVNKKGDRFVNEMDTRDKVTAAITKLPKRSAYLIFDSGVKKRVPAIAQYQEMGFVKKSDTIEGLATKINIPSKELAKTLKTWNKAVKNKKDTAFGRSTGMDNDLSKKEYYAIKIGPGIHYTMGGVKINTKTQVLNKDGKPIKGVFAAGEVVGGLHGQNRIGGNSVAEIIIFGRQAGNQSAAFVKANK